MAFPQVVGGKAGKTMFEVRNEDNQVISKHPTDSEAQVAARSYRLNRDMNSSLYQVFGPVAESSRQESFGTLIQRIDFRQGLKS